MKIQSLLESDRAGYRKGAPLSAETSDKFVYIFRAQPAGITEFTDGSYCTRSKKFAKEHAVHMANVEDAQYVVLSAMLKTEFVFNADNPGEYIYGGPPAKGKVIFTASPGDDFE
jgi:hypothetical protein